MNQEQKQTMAADEVVAMVVNQLCAISVPIGLKEQIADPIAAAVHNLRACLEAWKRDAETEDIAEVEEDHAD